MTIFLQLTMFPLSVCFSLLPHWNICTRGRVCWSKLGQRAYSYNYGCLCSHLWLFSNATQVGIFFPGCAPTDPMLCCGLSGAGALAWLGPRCMVGRLWEMCQPVGQISLCPASGASQDTCIPHKWSPGFSSLSICPSSQSSNQQRGLVFPTQ